jgi:NitT/TauT family transport system permease protein
MFLVAWEAAPRLHLVDVSFTSRPSLVLGASVEILRSGGFLRDVSVSLTEFALGFSLALVIGVSGGLLLGMFPVLRYLIDPPVMAIYATPELALLPILVVWLGIGMSSKVAIVFIGAVIPIIINSIVAVRQVDRSLVVAARSFCAGEREVFTKVILPASLPALMIGIRFGWSRAVLAVVVAEMYVSQEGIGNQIMLFGSAFRVAPLLFYVLLVSTFGFAGTAGLRKLEEWVGY